MTDNLTKKVFHLVSLGTLLLPACRKEKLVPISLVASVKNVKHYGQP